MTYRVHEHPELTRDVIIHLAYDIRTVRQSAWINQTELSDRSGISQSTMSMIENALAERVPLDKIAQVAASLGCDLLVRPCPHPPGISDLTTIGRVRRDLEGSLRQPLDPFPIVRRTPRWSDRP